MLPKQVQSLIEKYCMGVQPTDKQLDEIFAAVAEINADPAEVAAYMEKLQKGPTKAELEKKAKEEAAKKAKAEANAKAKAAAEKKANEEAARKAQLAAAAQKAKAEADAKAKAEKIRQQKIKQLTNGHEYVDLDLPSHALWSTCNIGAKSPSEYGTYYSWGETETQEKFLLNKYIKKGLILDTILKYSKKDGLTELELKDDVASVRWGGKWQMPDSDRIYELIRNCKCEFKTMNNVPGFIFSRNGKSIFFPAGGAKGLFSIGEEGKAGSYWLRERANDESWAKFFFISRISQKIDTQSRTFGLLVRPVILCKELIELSK